MKMKELSRVSLPCDISTLETIVLNASHTGHWHDAKVELEGNELVIKYPEQETLPTV